MKKGFATLLLLIGTVIICVLIAAIFFFVKSNLWGYKTTNNSENSSKSNISNNILFLTQDGKLALASLDGKTVEPFNTNLNEELKLGGAMTNPSRVSPDRNYLLVEGTKKDNGFAEYLISLKDKTFVRIDVDKIKKHYDYTLIIYFWAWTSDSKKIVYSADQRPDKLPGNIKRIIGTYDIKTKETKEIYSEEEYKTEFFPGRFGVIYYDSEKNLLTYTDDNAKTLKDGSGNKGYLINLKTKQKTQFKEPIIYNNGATTTGKYFATYKSGINPYKRKTLEIFSFDQPNVPISKISLDSSDRSFYEQYIKWSPNYDYFAIEVIGAQTDAVEKLANSRSDQTDQVFVYSRDGELVSRTDIPEPASDIIFSGSGQKVLVSYGSDKTKGNQAQDVLWKFYDIAGKEKPVDTSSSSLGTAIYWFD